MTAFQPIAIVGEGCVLPDALTPEALWQVVAGRQVVISRPEPGRFGVTPAEEAALSHVSGFVRGFAAVFDPPALGLDGIDAATLDPVCQWPLHAALQAWRDAGAPSPRPDRLGVIVANLSYPSRGHGDYAADIWSRGRSVRPPAHALTSALPPRVIAAALGGEGPAFALDAACASSLYALEIACRRLQAGTLDCAVIAAVNAADNLVLHLGFDALRALSPTGRSRPFVAGADGLVPSEGAVALVLKRLGDVGPGERVHALIRGIGLSNDGRRKGLLAPSGEGQGEAIGRAWSEAGLDPGGLDYLECHATGTPVGDGVEIAAAARAFAGAGRLPVGSLKANTGHLITAAGLASILKLTAALRHETLPPTPLDGAPHPAFAGTRLMPLTAPEPWARGERPRRAAVSNFGFGGNNAHLILEDPPRPGPALAFCAPKLLDDEIVVVGAGALAGPDQASEAVLRRLMNTPLVRAGPASWVSADPMAARTPPNDLEEAEPQQFAVLGVVGDALGAVHPAAAEASGLFVAMACAADCARLLLRARLAARTGLQSGSDALIAAQAAVSPEASAAAVLGAMANMTANRVSHARDFRGQAYALSAEAASSAAALEVAVSALRAGRLDMAVVAAADFAGEPVRAAALAALGLAEDAGDLAAALVLKRRRDAEAAGDPILATLDAPDWKGGPGGGDAALPAAISAAYGEAPVAGPLFALAVGALLAARGQALGETGAAPHLGGTPQHLVSVVPASPASASARIGLVTAAPGPMGETLRPPPCLFRAAAESRAALASRLRSGQTGGEGASRIALLAGTPDALTERIEAAARALAAGAAPEGEGVHFGEGPAEGDLAVMFTGSAAVYPRMGRGFLLAFPEVAATLAGLDGAEAIAPLLNRARLDEAEQLAAGTLLSQAHARLVLDHLRLLPDAALGLSLGETNALFAFGYWRDPGALLAEIADAEMYQRHIGGAFETALAAWGERNAGPWTNWRVRAPLAVVREALAGLSRVEITVLYTDSDCMIGGPAGECRRAAARLPKGAAAPMQQNLVVHARAMAPFADTWRLLHTRPVHEGRPVRLYANAINAAYRPDEASVADMLTRQAVQTVDFPETVRRAHADGVRTFVELGPRDTLSDSVRQVLAGKPHMAVAMDRIESSDLGQVAVVAATLFAEGRTVAIDWLAERLAAARRATPARQEGQRVRRPVPYRLPVVPDTVAPAGVLPAGGAAILPPAPALPPYRAGPAGTVLADDTVTAFPPPPPGWAASQQAGPPRSEACGTRALVRRRPTGPSRDRAAIEASARGAMSDFFGPDFAGQDAFVRQVRLPAPPLLLVDRITGIDARAGVEGRGVIWTETDLSGHPWVVHGDHVRPGPLIECGQADLTLIGWMGADLRNCSERVYRLLGCEITFHGGGLPGPGDTLAFQIEITGHATLAGVRMFFFQYDCRAGDRLVFSVRHGQAGFFTDDELAAGRGVVWEAASEPPPTARPAPFAPERASRKRAFSASEVAAFRRGDAHACFGEGFEACAAQTRPAHIPAGVLALFDDVPEFEPEGGPWGRGYMKARAGVPVDAWFYDGHFHNDPCMPGTLMAEAAVQALEFYAAAIGLTRERDSFVFEPVPGETAKFVCRGQVIPDRAHAVTYEVFVDEVVDGDTPVIHASLLARSDGRKVFHCPRFGLRLRRHWPAQRVSPSPLRIGPEGESRGDAAALLDCADGAPSSAFGPFYQRFDRAGQVPRLPQPPYHMISRLTEVSTRPGERVQGARLVAEYDVSPDDWYFADSASGAMPFSVLSEIALQPCGWLASHCGFAMDGGDRFRNLAGDGTVHVCVGPGAGTLRVETALTRFSRVGPMTIVDFDVAVRGAGEAPVLTLATQFGFFPAAALARQAGLPPDAGFAEAFAAPANRVEDWPRPDVMNRGRLAVIDTIDRFDPAGGAAGLGLVRGRQRVDPHAWYFRAHFFQDPVQPGSLGLDALYQLLAAAAQMKGLGERVREAPAPGQPVRWVYRGQVTPERREVTSVVEITDVQDEAEGWRVSGRGSLWSDGLRVYEIGPFSVRMGPA